MPEMNHTPAFFTGPTPPSSNRGSGSSSKHAAGVDFNSAPGPSSSRTPGFSSKHSHTSNGSARRRPHQRFLQSRMLAIARKEFFHIIYDFRTLTIVLVMPIIQLIMFGYALTMEIRKVDFAVVDFAMSTESRKLVQEFRGSTFFHLFYYDGQMSDIETLFQARRARAVIIIPADFDTQLRTSTQVPIQFLIDATDANAATLIKNYCTQVLRNYNEKRGSGLPQPFDVRTAVLFNPNLESSHFFVPGIIAMVLVMISALLTSIAISREKEMGTMEQILVSPVRPHEVILGKVLPYVGLAFLDGLLIVLIALIVFRVPFVGNPWLLVILSTLYILTALSLGLTISTRVRTQQVAMMFAQVATVLPTIMLSGLIFPIASMPKVLQYVTYIIPARYYLLIVRGIFLKGSLFRELLEPTLFLVVLATVFLVVSVRRFSMNLEQ